MLFGERLKQLRHKKYSQEELAALLKVHNNTISRWENGIQEPRMKVLKKIADIFGTTTAYLLGDTDNPSLTVGKKDDSSQVKISFEEKSVEHTRQQSNNERSLNRGMLVYETKNGERFEAPPTEEGIKFIERMRASLQSA